MKLWLIWFPVFCVLSFAVNAQDITVAQGEIRYCSQQGYYGNQLVRQSEYWQYHAPNSNVDDTYIIDYYLDTPVCGRLLLDYERKVAYVTEGDRQLFLPLSEVTADTPCIETLNQSLPPETNSNAYLKVSWQMKVLNESPSVHEITYPTQLLLAPAYIGNFPVLADAPLQPFDGRGFSQEIQLDALPPQIHLENGHLSGTALDELVDYYLAGLPGWQIAPAELTVFAENPTLLPGGSSAYLSLYNPDTEHVVELQFQIEGRQRILRVLVTVPETAVETQVDSVIEGSSQPLATLADFFAGWGGASVEPRFVFDDENIKSYTLHRDQEYWFVDLRFQEDSFDVIYSHLVTQTSCNPETYLPDWATKP